jgi:alkylation response protein AidB-like acyl-CoA dehydrogenase
MDFSWTESQSTLAKRTYEFARERLNRDLAKREREHRFAAEEWRLCGEFGLLGLCVPTQYGGLGLDTLTTACAVEAFGRGCEDAGLVFSANAHLFACLMPIAEQGSEPLKQSLLPALCSGERIGANAITEAEAGSDVFALKTRAVRDGEFYILNGTKSYVSNGPVAHTFLVYATTNPAHGYMAVTAFVVNRDTPGLKLGQPFDKMGLTTSPISSLYLEDCRVPAGNMLGKEGDGRAVFASSMQWERACLFAGYLGSMERQLEQTIAYAVSRRQFHRAISKNQAIAHRIVDMKMRLESARLLLYRACWLRDQGDKALAEVSLAKLAISEAAIHSSLDAIHIHGGNGFMTETGVERALRDAIPSTIFSGTSEIQRDLVAQSLGL